MSTMSPVRIRGRLDPPLSRWLWLVKWLLLIPHVIVLSLLGIAFGVVTVVAFFAILITGRYPRSLFDFNLGVMRWAWRVAYYGYSALGTDRYPPFSLGEVPDYPATLDIDYPEQLSRGLVLVKWWLLAIPHYIVVGILVGGAGYTVQRGENWQNQTGGVGLIGLLVFIAAVILLFRGRYPRGLYDLVMGLDRWVARVAAYAFLMTDRYPPFRLDMGGEDPPGVPIGAPSATSPAPYATALPPRTPGGWSAGRVVALVVSSVVAVTGAALAAGGLAVLVLDRTQRDAQGFLNSPSETFTTAQGYALVGRTDEVRGDGADWSVARRLVGDVKVEVTPVDGNEVFLGLARTAAVGPYLAGMRYDEVARLTDQGPSYVFHDGAAPSRPPGDAGVWTESSSGSGPLQVVVDIGEGPWTLVVMNADGSAGASVEGRIAAELPVLSWIAPTGILVGLLVMLLGGAGVLLAARQQGQPYPPSEGLTSPAGTRDPVGPGQRP